MTLPGLLSWILRPRQARPIAQPASSDASQPLLLPQSEHQQQQQRVQHVEQQASDFHQLAAAGAALLPVLVTSPGLEHAFRDFTQATAQQQTVPEPFLTAAALRHLQRHQQVEQHPKPRPAGTDDQHRPTGHYTYCLASGAEGGAEHISRPRRPSTGLHLGLGVKTHGGEEAAGGRKQPLGAHWGRRRGSWGLLAGPPVPTTADDQQQRGPPGRAMLPPEVALHGAMAESSSRQHRGAVGVSGDGGGGGERQGMAYVAHSVACDGNGGGATSAAAAITCCGLPIGRSRLHWDVLPQLPMPRPHSQQPQKQQQTRRAGASTRGAGAGLPASRGAPDDEDPHPPLGFGTRSASGRPITEGQGGRGFGTSGIGGGGWPGGCGGDTNAATSASATPFDPRHPRRAVHISRDGIPSIVKVDRHQLVADMGIAYRDLRAIDPALPIPTPTAILIRERALVVNLETVRIIVGSDQVYVLSVQHPLEGDGRLPGGYGGGDTYGMYGSAGTGVGAVVGGRVVDCVLGHPLRCPFIMSLCARLSATIEPSSAAAEERRQCANGGGGNGNGNGNGRSGGKCGGAATSGGVEGGATQPRPTAAAPAGLSTHGSGGAAATVFQPPPPPSDLYEAGSPFRTADLRRGGGSDLMEAAGGTVAATISGDLATGVGLPSGPLSGGSSIPRSHRHEHQPRRTPHFFGFHRRRHGGDSGGNGSGGGGSGLPMLNRQSTLRQRRSLALAAAWEAEQARREQAAAAAAAAAEEATVHGGGSDNSAVGGSVGELEGPEDGGAPTSPFLPPPSPPPAPPGASHLSLPTQLSALPRWALPPDNVGVAGGSGVPYYAPPPEDAASSLRSQPPRIPDGSGSVNGHGRAPRAMYDAAMLDLELPYELRALETALYEAVRLLDGQVRWLEIHVPRAADDLARGVSPAKLERVREAKRAIKAVGGRCRRLSAALRGILDDDDDMLDMYLGRRAALEGERPEEWHLPPELRQQASTDDSGSDGGVGGGAGGLAVGGSHRASSDGNGRNAEATIAYGVPQSVSASGVGASAAQDLGAATGSAPPAPSAGAPYLEMRPMPTSAAASPEAGMQQSRAGSATPRLCMLPTPFSAAAQEGSAAMTSHPPGGGSGARLPTSEGSMPMQVVDVQVPDRLARVPLPPFPRDRAAWSSASVPRVAAAHRGVSKKGKHRRRLHDRTDDTGLLPVSPADGRRRDAGQFGRPTYGSLSRPSPGGGSTGGSVSSDESELGSTSSTSTSTSSRSVSLATTDWAMQQAAAVGGTPRASPHDVEDCENLLEFYYVQAEALLGRLDALTERIDDTEDLVNIDLDNRRNQIVGIDLVVTSITLMFTFVTSVAGVFGMNMRNTMEDSVVAFYVTAVASFLGGLAMCAAFLGYVVHRRLLMLPAVNGGSGGWGASGGGDCWGPMAIMQGGGAMWLLPGADNEKGEREGDEERGGSGIWTWGWKDKVA